MDLKTSLKEIMQIPGATAAALVDVNTGSCLAQIGKRSSILTDQIDRYAGFVRAKEQILDQFGANDAVEEILVTTSLQYEMIYPTKIRFLRVKDPESLFFFVTLSKSAVTLALARTKMKEIVGDFTF